MNKNIEKILNKAVENKKILIFISIGGAVGGTVLGSVAGVIGGIAIGAIASNKAVEQIITEKLTSSANKTTSQKEFSLLLIVSSDKLKEIPPKEINLDNLKSIINSSSYFLLENDPSDILERAKTSTELPDLDKSSNFLLKITGTGTSDIGKYETKSWLRDNITSTSFPVEVFHLLDASIADKFVRTV